MTYDKLLAALDRAATPHPIWGGEVTFRSSVEESAAAAAAIRELTARAEKAEASVATLHAGISAAAREAELAIKRAERAEIKVEALESLRPVWAQGWASDGVAAQISSIALASIWEILGVSNQTDAMQRLRALIAERDEARQHVEELQEKLDPKNSCACSYDVPGTICGHHSPMLAKAEAEVARLREAVSAFLAYADQCPQRAAWGAGGQTMENVTKGTIVSVSLWEVEGLRAALTTEDRT